jgi:hypothetical protein
MTNYATVQVRESLPLKALTALYWDSLVYATGSVLAATRTVEWYYSEHTERGQVQSLVRQWLGWYGSRSVDCGPHNDYPNDAVEATLKAIVAKAYRLTY